MVLSTEGRIVVGVDGSESSLRALAWAGRQAELTGASLEVITAWERPITFGGGPFENAWGPQVDSQKVLDEAVNAESRTRPSEKVRSTLVEGHPAPVLVEASRDADALVVGSRGYGEFVGMLLGSVSQHCVTNAHCPVVVIRRARQERGVMTPQQTSGSTEKCTLDASTPAASGSYDPKRTNGRDLFRIGRAGETKDLPVADL